MSLQKQDLLAMDWYNKAYKAAVAHTNMSNGTLE